MMHTLDSRYPVVWRSPECLQFGGLDPVAVIEGVTPAHERMLSALATGATRSELAVIARSSGGTEHDADDLLAIISPALVRSAPPGTVVVSGESPAAEQIADALAWQGVSTVIAATADAAEHASGDLAVIVDSFVVEPAFHGLWLRRDVPHLPVVFGGAAVLIGPMVEPGAGPCLHCVERYRTDSDSAWPAIATQLWGRRAAVETPIVLAEAIALSCRLVLRRLAGAVVPSEELRLDTRTGRIDRQRLEPHPDCGCTTLAGRVSPSFAAHP
ncbi:TOMM precursor leader peptide-binding protein [Diaminobutyricimonas sp. LJ205]|uniref:TOMM precursor leader peptide-binding protein n=1 Tax=Diaminobutyricimonas sp. LJ205 TaxID=2683590 RepID=UPI0012F4AE69|nr:TOMM precursor leader peptide-binding protein [Diaminobutyricimonas sp. LJ205]